MGRGKKWTGEEVKKCFLTISTAPSVTEGFRMASLELNRTEKAIYVAWYRNNSGLRNYREEGVKTSPSTNRWTKEEVKVCLMLIKKNADNLHHAFRLASEQTDRSFKSIKMAYYGKYGALYRFKKGRYIFSLVTIATKVRRYFGRQVKNNRAKGVESLARLRGLAGEGN